MQAWHKVEAFLQKRFSRAHRDTPIPNDAPLQKTHSAEPKNQTRVLKMGTASVAFGLQWQPHHGANFEQQIKHLRQQGYKGYALSSPADVLGVSDISLSRKTISGALALADRHSKGGCELFVFHADAAHALVALNNGLPIPGFDIIGLKSEIKSAIQLFRDIKKEESIRIVGNVNWLEGMEPLSPNQAFTDCPTHVCLQPMDRWKTVSLQVGLIGFVVLLGVGAYSLYQTQLSAPVANAMPEDPNLNYERDLSQALLRTAPTGSAMMQEWTATIQSLPVTLGGWTLKTVKCRADACKSEWKRHHGSFADFSHAAQMALGVSGYETSGHDLEDPEVSVMHAIHPVKPERLQRPTLPHVDQAQRSLGTMLQDLLLLGARKAVLSEFKLFGSSTAVPVKNLRAPVLVAEFKLEADLWLLDEIELPHYVVPEGMELQVLLDGSSGKKEAHYGSFILSGAVYANAVPH
jgi:hypothetical protein